MAVKLSERSYEYAKRLVRDGKAALDERDDWSEHRPSAQQENDFIAKHGIRGYGRWHLGIDDEHDEDNKGRYKFPYGDFELVHRCAVLAAESRAGQRKYPTSSSRQPTCPGMLEELV